MRYWLVMSFKAKWMMGALAVTMFVPIYMSYAFVSWFTVTALRPGDSALTAYIAATYTIIIGASANFAGTPWLRG